jgi:hypothetical protein
MKLAQIAGVSFIAATALAITFGATTARADYNGGDAIMKGKMCWSGTDAAGHGFWGNCPKKAKAMKSHKKMAKKEMKK